MNRIIRQFLPFASLIAIIIALSILVPDSFLHKENFLNVLRRSSVYGIIGVGMTFIIISGGIDLSVGSMLAISAMIGAWSITKIGGEVPSAAAMVAGTFIGMLTGTVCGLLNGTLITTLQLPPFIVTLGAMSLYRGMSLVINDGQPFNIITYKYLGAGTVLSIPISVIIFAVIVAVAAFLLRYTRPGRYTYAIGSNTQAAFYAGISVKKNLIFIYTLLGFLVGLAAMIAASRTVSAQPTAGIGYELDIIAAVVIGGASLSGGRGTVLGTIIGTLLISFLRNGCTLLGISTNSQYIVIGIIIILAVSLDRLARSRANHRQSKI